MENTKTILNFEINQQVQPKYCINMCFEYVLILDDQ